MTKRGTSNVKDLLYYSESYDEDVDEDIWDDRKLNYAYDKALKIVNAEVAKRVAMSTNTQHEEGTQWKAGMPCRAVYDVDGQEYEAFVLRIINENKCIVKFLGYENSEIVSISTLKPSLGDEERNRQIEEAVGDQHQSDEAYTSQSPNTENMDCSDRPFNPGSAERLFRKNNKSSKKKRRPFPRGFDMPGMSFMPNMAAIRNLGSMEMPLPPPPVLGGDEDEALTSMLLSWYMSGYYTGLYQGQKSQK